MALELSILIATMPSRFEFFEKIYTEISTQGKGLPIEIIADRDMDCNIGEKRNNMLLMAKGEYIVFIDDDDSISPNYISLIMEAIRSKPDCVAIQGKILIENELRDWFISKSFRRWFTKGKTYYRTPNHISPVKREIALKAMFPEISHGEDAVYSKRILPFLKTETKIDQDIYFYYPSQK